MNNNIIDRINRNLDKQFLRRPSICKKIAAALEKNNLLVIAAGAGFGKTSAVMDYYSDRAERPFWLTLTANDNTPAFFWDTLMSLLPNYSEAIHDRLNIFNFPDNSQKLNVYNDAAFASIGLEQSCFVIDDLHVITHPDVVMFLSESIEKMRPQSKIILVTRYLLPWLPGNYALISEDDLRMTKDEVYALFALRAVNCETDFLQELWKQSKGWVFAMNTLSRKLQDAAQSDGDFIRDAWRSNVFNYFEREIFAGLPDEELRLLHTINITEYIPLTYFEKDRLARNPLIQGFIQINLQRDVVELHPLVAEYLKSHPMDFNDVELRAEYKKVATWCLNNNQRMLAAKYFAAAAEYARLIDNGTNEPLLIPTERAEFYRVLIEGLKPAEDNADYCMVRYIFYQRVLLSLRRFAETETVVQATIARFSREESPLAARILASSYLSLAFLHHYICPRTHEYDFGDYAAIAKKWYVRAGVTEPIFFGQLNNAPVRTYCCLVGENPRPGEFQQFITATRRLAQYTSQCLLGMYAGYDLLCESEYYLYKNDMKRTRELITQAMATHTENNQYALLTYALHIFIRLCVATGDTAGISRSLETFVQLQRNDKYSARTYYCPLLLSWLYIQTGIMKNVPAWLKVELDEKDKFEWIAEADGWMRARYFLKRNEPEKVLTMFYVAAGSVDPVDRTCLGQIDRAVVMALAYFKAGRMTEALVELAYGYQLALIEDFTFPFIEFGQDMADFCAAAITHLSSSSPESINDATATVPCAWLEQIRAQSLAYAKKLTYAIDVLFRRDNEDVIDITRREKDILLCLYQGLSREEIATTLHVSLSTIKDNLSTLFLKIGAKNSIAAVRYAIEKGIFEVNIPHPGRAPAGAHKKLKK